MRTRFRPCRAGATRSRPRPFHPPGCRSHPLPAPRTIRHANFRLNRDLPSALRPASWLSSTALWSDARASTAAPPAGVAVRSVPPNRYELDALTGSAATLGLLPSKSTDTAAMSSIPVCVCGA
jgi:hypothetical protein